MVTIKKGLEGVPMGESSIASINGKKGQLFYRGYDINDLAKCDYEEVSYLLVFKKLPTKNELNNYRKQIKSRQKLDSRTLRLMKDFSGKMNSMEALRTTVSSLSSDEPDVRNVNEKHILKTGIDLIAKFPAIIAAYYRLKNGKKIVNPNNKLTYSGNFLYMLNGKKPDEISEKSFNTDLILHAEHGMNASTFACRVSVSTLTDMYSAFTAAISTLKGPLHGGAAQEVYKTLRIVKTENNAEKFIMKSLAKHERIMGFGHRVYRTYDPRALILKEMCRQLSEQKGIMKWYNMSQIMEDVMLREKHLFPNVDFYSSTVYHLLGITLGLDTPIFAMGRTSGWVAHIMEQYSDNRLIRPKAVYIGPKKQKFIPIEKR